MRVDEETKIVYVVDLMNNGIQRWPHGETEGDTIAGGNGTYMILSVLFLYFSLMNADFQHSVSSPVMLRYFQKS